MAHGHEKSTNTNIHTSRHHAHAHPRRRRRADSRAARVARGVVVPLVLAAAVLFPTAARSQPCDEANRCNLEANPCITNVHCKDGQCQFDPVNCDDGSPCTINDRCDPSRGCVSELNCPSDDLVCNGKEECCDAPPCLGSVALGECFRSPLSCDDRDPCTCDRCDEELGGCQYAPRDCEDRDSCTADTCYPNATDNCEPGQGCLHEPIPDCCRTEADCHDACRTGRQCLGKVCTPGTRLSCDDADARTVDGCDPVIGCTHTSTLPGVFCNLDVDCPADPDPCQTAVCGTAATCSSAPLTGFDSLACVCTRADPPTCAGVTLPRSVTTRRNRACALIGRAAKKPARAKKLVRRAAKLLDRAGQRLAKVKRVSADCQRDAGALLVDGVGRAWRLEL
jgi:hypothetical protein